MQVSDGLRKIIPKSVRLHSEAISCIRFSPSSARLTACCRETVYELDLETDKAVQRDIGFPQDYDLRQYCRMTISHDCTRISTGFSESPRGLIPLSNRHGLCFVELDTRRRIETLGNFTPTASSFSGDDRKIVTGSKIGVHLWDVCNGEMLAGPFSTTSCFRVFSRPEVVSITFSPDERLIFSGLSDGSIHIKDLDHPYIPPMPFDAHSCEVKSIVAAPNGDQIVSGSLDGTICVWNLRQRKTGPLVTGWTAERRWQFQGFSCILSVAVSPGGNLVAGGGIDGSVIIWDLVSLTPAPLVLVGFPSAVNCIAFAPDSKFIAAGREDGTIAIWRL